MNDILNSDFGLKNLNDIPTKASLTSKKGDKTMTKTSNEAKKEVTKTIETKKGDTAMTKKPETKVEAKKEAKIVEKKVETKKELVKTDFDVAKALEVAKSAPKATRSGKGSLGAIKSGLLAIINASDEALSPNQALAGYNAVSETKITSKQACDNLWGLAKAGHITKDPNQHGLYSKK